VQEQAGQRKLGGSGGAGGQADHRAARFEYSAPSAVREETEVADANQAARQDVKQEAAQELLSGNDHDLGLAAAGMILKTL